MTQASYEVFALKYAERDARRPDNFVGGDPHGVPMPMDYFIWPICNDERLERATCFPTTFHPGQVLEGYEKLRALADAPAHIVPGHDPLVIRRYPAASPAPEGIVARLDAEPAPPLPPSEP